MARNRKSQAAELRFGPALKALLICFFIGGAGIGYVYQKDLLQKLGKELEKRENELERLRVSNEAQAGQRWETNSLRILERRVRELGLDLRPSSPSQIVVVVDEPVGPAVRRGRAEGGSQLARGEESELYQR